MTAIASTFRPSFTEVEAPRSTRAKNSTRVRNSDLEFSGATVFEVNVARQWRYLQNELSSLAKYDDDWDGMDSAAPPHKLVANALAFLEEIKQNNYSNPPTEALLGPNGTIAIEWRYGTAKLQAEISSSATIDWFELVPGQPLSHLRKHLRAQSTGGDADWTSVKEVEDAAAASASAL